MAGVNRGYSLSSAMARFGNITKTTINPLQPKPNRRNSAHECRRRPPSSRSRQPIANNRESSDEGLLDRLSSFWICHGRSGRSLASIRVKIRHNNVPCGGRAFRAWSALIHAHAAEARISNWSVETCFEHSEGDHTGTAGSSTCPTETIINLTIPNMYRVSIVLIQY